MDLNEQRIRIAEACGWKRSKNGGLGWWLYSDSTEQHGTYAINGDYLPDYPNDLNAMHEAEKYFDDKPMDVQSLWYDFLGVIVGWDGNLHPDDARFTCNYRSARATASQRAEAFLRTIGKWTE